jgi:hypothetical protein
MHKSWKNLQLNQREEMEKQFVFQLLFLKLEDALHWKFVLQNYNTAKQISSDKVQAISFSFK